MKKLSRLAINAEGFIFNPDTGDSFQVSETGLLIINALVEGKNDDEIINKLTMTYEVLPEVARQDLADFNGRLKMLNLI